MSTKVAVITEDKEKISAHFGMAPLYKVFTIEDGQVIGEDLRDKPHHGQHPQGDHGHDHGGHGHADMLAPIQDCQILISGGMGEPAYRKAEQAGLQIFLAGGKIGEALQAYLDGRLQSDPRRVHRH